MFNAKDRGYDIDLYRSQNRWIAGVCAGIAENMQWSVTGVRILTILLFMFTGAFAVLAYIAAIFLLASRPAKAKYTSADERWEHNTNIKDKMFDKRPAASLKVEELRERLRQIDRRIRAMEEHVTSRKFQFEREMRRSP